MKDEREVTLKLLEEDPYGVKEATLDNWTGRVVVGPFSSVSSISRMDAAKRKGVYFLVSDQDAGHLPEAYIGKAKNVANRLLTHKNKEWQKVCLITSGERNLDVDAVEKKLIRLANECGRVRLRNKQGLKSEHLSEDGDSASARRFVKNIRLMLSALGMNYLHPAKVRSKDRVTFETRIPRTSHVAYMEPRKSEQGDIYVVLKGSKIRIPSSDGKHSQDRIRSQYRQLLEQKKIEEDKDGVGKFLEDASFSSVSNAASIVKGNRTSGRRGWQVKGKKETYGKWQEKMAESDSLPPLQSKSAGKPAKRPARAQARPEGEIIWELRIPNSDRKAHMAERNGMFVVLKGSHTRVSWRGADRGADGYRKQYADWLRAGQVKRISREFGEFIEDVPFDKISRAAALVVGKSRSGNLSWRRADDPKTTYGAWKGRR